MNTESVNRPESRTALGGRELARYDVEIAALSETRFAETGQILEVGARYTFFWRGRGKEERRESVGLVGFAIKSKLVKKLPSLPNGIDNPEPPFCKEVHTSIMSVYAPVMTNSDEVRDQFYANLDITISSVPKTYKLIILGDSMLELAQGAGSGMES